MSASLATSAARAADRSGATHHAVVIVGAGPTGLTLAAELALAKVEVVIIERRASQDLVGSRAGGLHARTIEELDQRGIADRFLAQGQVAQVAGFAWIRLDISDFPTRHPYGLALGQSHIERILADWVGELGVPIHRGHEVTAIAQDDTGVDIVLDDGRSLRADYLVGCDGGRSPIRKAAGIDFPGWGPTISCLIAETELTEEPAWGLRRDDKGIHSFSRLEDGKRVRLLVTEPACRTQWTRLQARLARSQRGAHRRLWDRLRNLHADLDLQVHRYNEASGILPEPTGPAGR